MQYYNSKNARISPNKFLKDTVTDPLKAPSLDLIRVYFVSENGWNDGELLLQNCFDFNYLLE